MQILRKAVVKFELKQMTPMIHFQGEERGAGIRASDLKPRFDFFLKKYWYDCLEKNKRTQFDICILKIDEKNGPKVAFDYKVKINNNNKIFCKDKNSKKKICGAYYGELKENKLSFYDKVEITFITEHEHLKMQIEKYFPIFLSVNGFGLRNNKGYGYFKLKCMKSEEILKNILKYQELKNKYIGILKEISREKGIGIYQLRIKSIKENVPNILNEIRDFHQILKSGKNYNDYVPSIMLKKYIELRKEDRLILEKKYMKLFLQEKKYDISALTQKERITKNEKIKDLDKAKIYYVRGLLGLAPFYEFKKVKKEGKSINVKFNTEIDGVERFPSPINYLPISNEKIILLVDYSKIDDFRKKQKNAKFKLENKNLEFELTIPNENQYSIHEIFKKDGILKKYIKKWEYEVISDIK